MARLGLSPSLQPTPRSTNAVESMALRRAAAAVLEAETQPRRVNGHRDPQVP